MIENSYYGFTDLLLLWFEPKSGITRDELITPLVSSEKDGDIKVLESKISPPRISPVVIHHPLKSSKKIARVQLRLAP